MKKLTLVIGALLVSASVSASEGIHDGKSQSRAIASAGGFDQANEGFFQFQVETYDGRRVLTLDSTQSIRLLGLMKTGPGVGFSREASAAIQCRQSSPMEASCWVLLPERK